MLTPKEEQLLLQIASALVERETRFFLRFPWLFVVQFCLL